ncbi:alpha/beta fold hydrolase [Nocardia sp. NBC_01377]|uniref:thioesterase II family protein n=1 Tax=Nocardia sp. NBC_01377 TaxID=2903595 RepID=UPI00324F9FFF
MNREPWIVPMIGASGPAARLVFFPHAGGSVNFYLPLARLLSISASISGIQYPGRQERRAEPGLEDLTAIADHAYDALTRAFDEPLILFGHSMGAIAAFETARRYARDGRHDVAALVVSGRAAPDVNHSAGLELLNDDDMIAALIAQSAIDAALIREPDVREMILAPLRTDYRAVGRYRHAGEDRLECPVLAYWGDRDPATPPADIPGWEKYTTGTFSTRSFDGGHFFVNELRTDVAHRLSQDLQGIDFGTYSTARS